MSLHFLIKVFTKKTFFILLWEAYYAKLLLESFAEDFEVEIKSSSGSLITIF